MSLANEAHVLIYEVGHGFKVGSVSKKWWDKLSPTFLETRLSFDGIPVWVKYQAWMDREAVTDLVETWLHELEQVSQ